MPRKFITLEYQPTPGTAGTQKSLADWGFVAESGEFKNQGRSTFTFRLPLNDPSAANEVIPFEGWVVLRVNVTGSGSAQNRSYSGGTAIFRGYCVNCQYSAAGASASQLYTFADPWYALEHRVFMQRFKAATSIDPVTHKPVFGDYYTSDLFLFQGYGSALYPNIINKITTGQQILDIVQYAAAQGDPIAAGQIDPQVNVPIYQVKEIMCSEAIQNCLKSAPDVVSFFDHTNHPPVIHFKRQAGLATVTLPYGKTSTEPYHLSTKLTSRNEMVAPLVWINYRIEGSLDGATFIQYLADVYPNNGTPTAFYLNGSPGINPKTGQPFTGRERRVLMQTVDITGTQTTNFKGSLKTISSPNVLTGGYPTNMTDSINVNRIAFWSLKQPQYKNCNGAFNVALSTTKYNHLIIGQGWIEDQNGNDITASTLASGPWYVLESGSPCPWMVNPDGTAVVSKHVSLKACVGFDEYDERGIKVKGVDVPTVAFPKAGNEISTNVTITNAQCAIPDASNALVFSGDFVSTKSVVGSEPIPADLAQQLYNAVSILEYEGDHVIKEQYCSMNARVGKSLTISGGLPGWTNMLIHTVSYDFTKGVTRVSVGPSKYLGASEFMSIFLFNRFRRTWKSPFDNNTGSTSQAGQLSIGADTPKENTTHALSTQAFMELFYKLGTPITNAKNGPSIKLNPAAIVAVASELGTATPPIDVTIQPKKFLCCDQATGASLAIVTMSTDTFTPA